MTIGSPNTYPVLIFNVGAAPLKISNIALAGADCSEFEKTSGPNSVVIPPWGSRWVKITYDPVDENLDNQCHVRIESNDPEMPIVRVRLKGKGVTACEPDIGSGRDNVDFGCQTIGVSTTERFAISNSFGCATLAVTQVDFVGDCNEFVYDGPTMVKIEPGSRVRPSVTYTPEDEGPDTCEVHITSNDPEEALFIMPLLGKGVSACEPDIGLGRNGELDFGCVLAGETSEIMRIAVSNSFGCAPLHISSIALGSGTSSEFEILNNPGSVTVEAGAHIFLRLRYTPQDEGPDSGTVRIESDDSERTRSSSR